MFQIRSACDWANHDYEDRDDDDIIIIIIND